MDADYIAVWLRKPIAALEDEKALDLIGRGDYRAVAAVISSLEDPPPSDGRATAWAEPSSG